ncbi:hypothetical protein VFPPC_14003 [Pochonia chlamydosporia 170]|uniref:Uncharacterized protein n=1 Tax=Pochonia chlamydosporia 170 TaxID=1380566 RepID=A0A179FI94_METCM|nr:hypothetical protein VFPPC_14003 [Pochonia chlamydosporia 170]OAQ65147.1 hypothetical protein VFPPC_14003 [Pochonia chlamydosporia 170]
MAFFEDPRLRQRWNQITHDAETVTENAAAGIFTFQQNYINPCFASIADSVEQCTTVCLGDPDDRLRRRRERQRAREGAEFSFDFYDDWYEEEQSNGGLLGSWGGEDWDRLLAGTGSARKHSGETNEQPRRKRGMSYGTRGTRRKVSQDDPTIIPSTQPIGFLSKLPWKMGGTLRYKPSAADLQDHPGKHDDGESAPLLAEDDESDYGEVLRMPRQRSGTTGSGGTSDSYRSRGDLFPSDGEGEEDAVPLDDDVTYDMVKRDDRSSGKTRSSKGKSPAGQFGASRTVSRSTLGSTASNESPDYERTGPPTPDVANIPSMEDLHAEEERLRREEDEELRQRKAAATQLASERGLSLDGQALDIDEAKAPEVEVDEIHELHDEHASSQDGVEQDLQRDDARDQPTRSDEPSSKPAPAFHAARLPHFG